MKKYKIDPATDLYEVVVPLSDESCDDGLFDDCPLCQQLKRDLQRKKTGGVVIQWEDKEPKP